MAKVKKASDETVSNPQDMVQDTQAAENMAEVPESITLVDLQILVNIVDLASSRGAFRGGELAQVGAVYDKLAKFLSYVANQQKKAQEEQEAAQAAA